MKSFKIIIVLVVLFAVLFGAVNNQNLNDLDIVMGVGVDFKDDKYSVSLQSLNLTKQGTGADALSGNITANIIGKGKTISDAVSDCSKELSKKVFFGHNNIVVLGAGTTKHGIEKCLDYLLRSVDSRPDVYVILAEKSASEIMQCTQNESLVPAENIASLVEAGEKSGFGALVMVKDVLDSYASETTDIYLPVLKTNESENKKKNCEIKGVAIFSDENYKATLNKDETQGLLFLDDKIKGGTLSLTDEKLGNIGIEITKSSTKLKVFHKGNQVFSNVNVNTNIIVNEIQKGIITALDNEQFMKIEKLAEKQIEKECYMAIEKTKTNSADVFDIGRHLSMTDQKYYDSVKKDWHSVYKNINFSVKSKCSVKKINDNSVRD